MATDSPFQQQLFQTLAEFQRTLYSVRTLSSLLTRRPGALISGRQKRVEIPVKEAQ
jgi:paraquat-inducible protein B